MSDCLLLNADGAPVSMLPLSIIDWREAIKYLVIDKAVPITWHDNWIVHSPNWQTAVPAVMMLHDYMKTKTTVRFSKANIFLRDEYHCQYCDLRLEKNNCTIDHVIPVSLGGKSTWNNAVTACLDCNAEKGQSTAMKPRSLPKKPDIYELIAKRKKMPFAIRHESWRDFLE